MRRTLLVLGLVACGGSPPKALQVVTPAEVTVLDPGAEPRQVLRFVIPAHTVEREDLQFDQAVGQTLENTVLETSNAYVHVPMIHAVARVEVTDVAADGTMAVHAEIERASYEPVADAKLRGAADQEVARLRKLRLDYRLSPSGGANSSSDELAPDALFPDVPIGVGAAWRVTTTIAARGIRWTRTTIYHLRSVDDTGASVEVETSAIAAPQTLAVDPHSTTEVTGGHAEGHAQYLVPLHGLVPTGGGHTSAAASMQLVRGHLRIRSQMQFQQDVMVKPVASEPTVR